MNPDRSPGLLSPPAPAQATAESRDNGDLRWLTPQEIKFARGFNPRTRRATAAQMEERMGKAALEPLALNMLLPGEDGKPQGVLQPVLVRGTEGSYTLIAGERRVRAARLAGLEWIPARVVVATDAEAYRMALAENAQRKDLDVVNETFNGFDLMQEHTGMTLPALRAHLAQVRKGRAEDVHGLDTLLRTTFGVRLSSWANHRAVLLDATEKELEAVESGHLTLKAFTPIVRCPEPQRGRVMTAVLAMETPPTLAQVQALIAQDKAAARPSPLRTVRGHFADYERQLRTADAETRRRVEEIAQRASREIAEELARTVGRR